MILIKSSCSLFTFEQSCTDEFKNNIPHGYEKK